ncbi:MAG: ABC transporter permease, partial [Paenibacillus sp.]|nr:ABC transporter permease [Paenibacillus sp.]
TLVINIMVYSLNPVLGFFEQPVRLADMMDAAPSVLINACMVAGISLISLFFGMRKKSTAAAITSAVIVGFLINVTVSDGGSPVSLFQFIGVPISLCILGLAIGLLSYHRIDKKDLS